MAAVIGFVAQNKLSGKYELSVNDKIVGRSQDPDYFEYHLRKGDLPKLKQLGVSKIVSKFSGAQTAVAAAIPEEDGPDAPVFTINDRFEIIEEFVRMTVNGSSKAMMITGRGGVGKSFKVEETLLGMGKTSVETALALAPPPPAPISEDDTEEEIAEKVAALANPLKYDYIFVSGKTTPKALYRTLFENRAKGRVTVLDDCDTSLENGDCISILKAAVDTKTDRYVYWNTTVDNGDLPNSFKYEGQIIFITNKEMDDIDEAVRTRCIKVNISMSPEQRLEYMENVLENVGDADIPLECKQDALNLLRENLPWAKDVSFRMLLSLIKVRTDREVRNWKKTGQFLIIGG